MAGRLKAISAFFRSHFILAFACGLASGIAVMGYETQKGEPEAATYALMFAAGCMAMMYVIKAMTAR
ncbi:MAG: hypothetical protein JWO78_1044 [Micavibrio sp.]|nr:hypothetical protein [Micavibrio sp.]